jgi:hypothetical protein
MGLRSLQALGLKLGAIALVAWPVAAAWLVLSAHWDGCRNTARRRWKPVPPREAEMNITMTRREFAALAGAALLAPPASGQTGELITRAMPSSGERSPTAGLGTA